MTTSTKKPKTNKLNRVAIAACSFALTAGSEIQLFPAGEFRTVDGRPTDAPYWLMTADIAARLIEQFAALTNPVVVDYEHQTYNCANNGQPSPAAGWFKTLRWEEGAGLFATVEWTERATAHIEAGEYRYISPVMTYDPDTGFITQLINAALTNNPAIDGMEAVSARLTAELNQPEKLTMELDELLERIRYLLNLPMLSTPEEVAAELQKAVDLIKQGEGEAVAANTLGVVGLTQLRSTELASLRGELTASATALSAVKTELATLKQANLTQQVNSLIAAALTAHKIAPAQKESMTELGMSNPALLSRLLEAAVAVVEKGETAPAPELLSAGTSFVAPPRYAVSDSGMETLSQAQAYQKTHGGDLIAAVRAVETL